MRQTGQELSQPKLGSEEYNVNQQLMSQETMSTMAVDIPIQSSSQFTRMPDVQQQENVGARHIPLARGITLKPSRRQQQFQAQLIEVQKQAQIEANRKMEENFVRLMVMLADKTPE